eukprot:11852202-Heterocapsa_arctica.AAC.1
MTPSPASPDADANVHVAAPEDTDPLSPHAQGFVVLASWVESPDEDPDAADDEPQGDEEENHMADG